MEKIQSFDPNALIIAFGGDIYKNDLDTLKANRTQLYIDDYKKISINYIYVEYYLFKPNNNLKNSYNIDNICFILHSFLSGF